MLFVSDFRGTPNPNPGRLQVVLPLRHAQAPAPGHHHPHQGLAEEHGGLGADAPRPDTMPSAVLHQPDEVAHLKNTVQVQRHQQRRKGC